MTSATPTSGRAGLEPVNGVRLALWATVAVVGIDLLFFTGSSNFLASAQARILNQLLFLGAAALLGLAVVRGRVDTRSPLVLPGLAWIAATVAATVLSQRPATSLEALAILFLAAPAYLIVRAVTWTPWLAGRVDRLIVAATLVFAAAYLLQAFLLWVSWWSVAGPGLPPLRPGDAGLSVGTVNAVALYIELLVPLAAWVAWRTLGRPRLGALIAVLGVAGLVVTGSRGAWLGAAAGAVVVAVVAWLRAGRPLPGRSGGRDRVAVIAVGIVALAGAVLLAPVLVPRLLAGDAGRWELWSAAWTMFTGQPVTGPGPGTYPLLRPGSPISEANLAVVTTSHNSILQVLVEVGIVGFAVAAWLLAVVARLAYRGIRGRAARPTPAALVVAGSLVAMLVHSVVDIQLHIPGVVLLVFLLVARLDPPAAGEPAIDPGPATAPHRPRAAFLVAGGAMVIVGAVILVPVDAAMVRAQLGNNALDRGDPAAALADFRWAAGIHELAPYRLGEGLAAARLGDEPGAAAAFDRAATLHGLSTMEANRAAVADAAAAPAILDWIEANGRYDVTALANAAVLRFPGDPARAAEDLALAMAGSPTLIFSERPPTLFDDATWAAAQARTLEMIRGWDPATATAMATLAGLDDDAARYRAEVPDPALGEALDLLATAKATGSADLGRAYELLRDAPGSQGLHNLLWLLGFTAKDQALVDDVGRLSVVAFFGYPSPPMELVVDGKVSADYSARIPRYPMASDFRNAPKRPYGAGMVTIEPVFRPK